MYFIRHGQSEFNVPFDTTGIDPMIIDAPLTKEGRAQVARDAANAELFEVDI